MRTNLIVVLLISMITLGLPPVTGTDMAANPGSDIPSYRFLLEAKKRNALVEATRPSSADLLPRIFIPFVSKSELLPASGKLTPEMKPFDQAMLDFMVARHIESGTLAVMKDGILLLQRGYGWLDGEHSHMTPPDALMRIASVDKPITTAAIKRLMSQGRLAADTTVFPFLSVQPPPGQTPDPRLQDITIKNLLDHQGGWDSQVFDPMFHTVEIAAALGIPSPATTPDIVRYMAGQPLQFTPGTQTRYCNFCYSLLRLIVEKASGQSFVAYVQQELGIADVDRSYAFPQDRNPREVWYNSGTEVCQNVYQPGSPEPVPCADGGLMVESRTLAASSPALARFLDAFWVSGEARLPAQTGYIFWFFGSLPGTFSFVYQRPDGVNIVALFNQRQDASNLPYDDIKNALDDAVSKVGQWPPRKEQIAFYSSRDGNDEIYTMNTDGTGATNITNNPASDKFPAWSPDGRRIAFHTNRDGNWEIYVVSSDGGSPTNLTHSTSDNAFAAWAPDGKRVAFTSSRSGRDQLYLISNDGTGLIRLTNDMANDRRPAWSPDGLHIAFYSDRDGNNEIYVMDSDGGNQRRLTSGMGDNVDPAWSPNGTRIAFTSNRNGNPELYMMNPSGSDQVRLTDNPADDACAAWSPNGSRIAFHSNRDGPYAIYAMNADGSQPIRLTYYSSWDGVPSWTLSR